MTETSLNLSMPYIQEGQAQKHITHNEALEVLDAVVQLSVDGISDVPPLIPVHGARWIVGAQPEDDWVDHAHDVAIWHGAEGEGRWMFLGARLGWRSWIVDEARSRVWDGSSWRPTEGAVDQLPELGIATSSDSTNKLAVSAGGTLLTHAGSDHRMTINKADAADTASILFQSGWSGRAELGLTGSDDLAVKVSPDGAAWTTALSFQAATGAVGGSAVQQAPDDTSAGRLMRADWGYGPGNALAPVGLAGGIPTGGLIENGETPEGSFVRFADGTLICTGSVTLDFSDPARLSQTWVFPRPFAGGSAVVNGIVDAGSIQAAPGHDEIGALVQTGLSADQVTLTLFRVAGRTDFAASDTVSVSTYAIGRWG